MYDENGIISHANSTSTASETITNSIASSSSSLIPSTLAGVVSNFSDSNSPTASAASDCSYDSVSGDQQARIQSQLLLYQSLASNPSLLPLLNGAAAAAGGLGQKSANTLAFGAVTTPVVGQPQLRPAKIDPNMALINTSMMNVKDSRWLQVEVCREFQRGQCSRNEQECKFAHPPPHVDVQNGRVTACYDHLKGRCTRDNPKCKFLHAPQHLKDQLLLNGRNNLALKNYMTQLSAQATTILPPAAAAVAASNQFTNFSPFAAVPATGAALVPGAIGTYNPYAYALNTAVYPGLMSASQDALGTYGGLLPTGAATSPVSMAAAVQQAQKAAIVRVDRVEVCREFVRGACQRGENECKYAHPKPEVERASDGTVVVCIDYVRKGGGEGACGHKPCRYYHPPPHLLPAVAARLAQQPSAGQQSQVQSSHHRATPTAINGASAGDQDQSSSATAALLMAYQQQLQQQLLAIQQPFTPTSTYVGHPMQLQQHAHASAASSAALPASSATMQAAAAAQAYAASQLAAAAAQHPIGTSVAKKRPLEPDSVVQQISAHSAATDSLLLAAAAFQSAPMNKRTALEKGGVPVFQPMTTVNALQYPQFAAAFPGLQTSYVPVTFTAATTAAHAPAPASAAATALPGGDGGGAAVAAALQQQQQLQQLQALVAQQHSSTAQLMSAMQQQQGAVAAAASLVGVPRIPNNVASVAYFDESGQLLDTLPVCRDFKQGRCERPNCRYVHLLEDYVEMSNEGKVTVCRDFAKGKCSRVMCKYYHVPLLSPIAASSSANAAALLASSTSPFSSYLPPPSASSSPPWSIPSSALWLQRFQQQPSATDFLNSASFFPTVSPSIAASTNQMMNFDHAAVVLSQQQQALLAAQQSALLNSTAAQQQQKMTNWNGATADDASVTAIGSVAAAVTTASAPSHDEASPATNAGGGRS